MVKSKMIVGIVAALAVVGIFVGNSIATSKAEDAMAELKLQASVFGAKVEYEDVSANIFGTVELEDVSVTLNRDTLDIETVSLSGLAENVDDISDITLMLEGLSAKGMSKSSIDKTPDSPIELVIYSAVMNGNELDAMLDISIDQDKNELAINELTIEGQDMGDISLSTTIYLDSPIKQGINIHSNLNITNFAVTAQDSGLADLFFEIEAERKNTDADELKDKFFAKAEKGVSRAKGVEKEFMEAALDLIDGDRVTMERETDEKVSMDFNRLRRYGITSILKEAKITFS